MGYVVEVQGVGDPQDHYCRNALVFDSKETAEAYGFDLQCRWMGMDDYRIKEVDEPVNRKGIKQEDGTLKIEIIEPTTV